ncbi:MAG: glycosyltransferase involved in cell wall biosynthesis [Planctomycetota bacterium]|jgi:glycosyltransferase involved in cell wall biosynthesis
MKILMVVHNFPPAFTGGTERAAELLSLELVERGHEVQVFCGASDAVPEAHCEDEIHHGLKVRRFFRSEDYKSPVDVHDPDCESAFEDIIREFQPDVMHLHHWVHLSTGLVSIAARNNVPSVITLHDYWTTCSLFFRLPDDDDFCRKEESLENCLPCLRERRPMEEGELIHSLDMRFRSLMSELLFSSAIVISGQKQLENIAQLGRYPRAVFEKIRLVPIGVVPAQFVVEREVEPEKSDLVTIGHWGNLSAVKGLEVLVQAAAKSKYARRLKIKLIGELKDTNLLARLHEAAGAARIELLGRYAAESLPKLIADVDVGVFPSLCEETHSIVLDEALLAGLPVIVSDRGAMAARVGQRGIVVPANDVQALTKALDEMADESKRREYAAAPCGDVVDSATYAAQIEEIYLDLKPPAQGVAVPDLGRDRLTFRNRRFFELGRFALAADAQKRNIEEAIRGDAGALESLRERDPRLAARIEVLLGTTKEDKHDD